MSDAIKLTVASEPTLSLGVGSDGVSPSQFADLEKWLRDQWSAVEAEVDTAIDGVEYVDASVTKTGGTATISVTGRDGNTRTATVHDGNTGPAGYSPTVTITDGASSHTVTITDRQGDHSYTVPTYADEEAERAQEWDVLAQEAQDATDAANAAAAGITDANLPSLHAGSAASLTSTDGSAASFMARTSPRDGTASIESIKGRTLGWNQLASTAKPASDSTVNGVTITNNHDGTFTLNGTASEATVFNIGDVTVGTSNHKILVNGCPSGGAASKYRLKDGYGVNSDVGGGIIDQVPNNNTIAQIIIASGYTCDNLVFRPQLFDLTAMFGAGNEPATVEEFTALFPEPYYPYDAGSLLSVQMEGIETVGFNQWDTDTSGAQYIGHYYIEGEKYNYVKRENSNYDCYRVPVFPSTEYCISVDSDTLGSIANKRYVDASGNFISGDVVGWDALYGVFTTPSTAKYIEVSVPVGTTKKLCINLSGPRNGEYEPYLSEQRAIPAATYFPDGMRSAGSVYDELTETQAVTRVGEVDLGTLEWTRNSYGIFFASPTNMAPPKTTNAERNNGIVCAAYGIDASSTTINESMTDGTMKRLGGHVYIQDTAYTDVAAFKAAMSGVMLHYELATATITPIDPALNLTYKAASGGTERVMHDEPTAPPTMVVAYGYTAASLLDAATSMLADPDGPTATTNHAVGSYLTMGGTLYRVTTAIATGEAITPGTNVTATTVMAEILSLIQ